MLFSTICGSHDTSLVLFQLFSSYQHPSYLYLPWVSHSNILKDCSLTWSAAHAKVSVSSIMVPGESCEASFLPIIGVLLGGVGHWHFFCRHLHWHGSWKLFFHSLLDFDVLCVAHRYFCSLEPFCFGGMLSLEGYICWALLWQILYYYFTSFNSI